MDITRIRQLLREGAVVLVEEGQPPLLVRELPEGEQPQEVPISARWPKGRSVLPAAQDQVLERLNKEILALKEQIAQEESGVRAE
jgi:hypothetical protein